jgi:hypothetical protein
MQTLRKDIYPGCMVSRQLFRQNGTERQTEIYQKGQVELRAKAVLEPCRKLTQFPKTHRELSRASGNLNEWSHWNTTFDLPLSCAE